MFFDGMPKAGIEKTIASEALLNTSCLLLNAKHAGSGNVPSAHMFSFDFTKQTDVSFYENVYFSRASGTLLLQEGYAGETRDVKESNGSSLTVSASKSPKYLMSITPNGYANLNHIVVNTYTSVSGSFTDQVKLYCGGQLVAESAELVNTENGNRYELSFSNVLLDPNKTYDIYFITDREDSRIVTTVEVQSTPVVFAEGSFETLDIEIPMDASRIVFYMYSIGQQPEVALKIGDKNYESVVSEKEYVTQGLTGAACTARRYSFEFTPGAHSNAKIKVYLGAYDSITDGCFGIFQ